MRHALKLHPDSPCVAAKRIEVKILRPNTGNLVIAYFVTGMIANLRIPSIVPAARADGLWQTTCFEAFIRPSADTVYYEFNFAPSTQWAAYRFDSYRNGMQATTGMGAPRIDVQSSPGLFTLHASLDLDQLPGLRGDATWRLGLSAIVEETNGLKSYWALAHPPGKPDFHHADCFSHDFTPA